MGRKRKKEVEERLTRNEQRVFLTNDTWTSVQNIHYMVVNAHVIDSDCNFIKEL